MKILGLRFALFVLIASTTTVAWGAAPTLQLWPPVLTLYSGESATLRAFFFGDWNGRYKAHLHAQSEIISVPAEVDGTNRAATFDVTAWKPGVTTIAWVSFRGLFTGVHVTVLPHDVSVISPARAATAGGEPITIEGDGFSSGCMVWFDGVPAAQVTLVDRQKLIATTPAHAAGASDVRVLCGAFEIRREKALEFTAPRRRSARH